MIKSYRILVCDDDDAVRSSLGYLLSKAGYTPFFASKPEDILKYLIESDFDLLLLDMNFSLSINGDEGIDLLKKIKKGATPEEMVQGCAKAKEAGFELSLYVLLGLGGEALSEAHARDTAGVLSRIDPHFIRLRTLQPQPGSQMFDDMEAGVFIKATHATVLREQKILLENLEATSHYLSDHITNYISVNGRLPGDRQAMLRAIDEHIAGLAHNAELQARCARKDRITNL